jgi:putative restriction endonuclease
MRIALRTSGGRGEYELVGRQGAVDRGDLYDRRIRYEITPDIVIDGRSAAHMVQGKPRIRLEQGGKHIYRVLADVLLLPRPIRELRRAATGPDFIRDQKYAMKDIDIDVVGRTNAEITLRLTRVWLSNSGGRAVAMDLPDRMALVQSLWDKARGRTDRLALLLQEHENAATLGDMGRIQTAADKIRRAMRVDGDCGPVIATNLGVAFDPPPPQEIVPQVPETGIEDDAEDMEATVRAISKWRRQADRGPEGRRFSQQVKSAYDFTCAVMGTRLPRLPAVTGSSGTDSAHILPWARYDLNRVTNGLCLCKLCHWAFDNGILRITPRLGGYEVSTPD